MKDKATQEPIAVTKVQVENQAAMSVARDTDQKRLGPCKYGKDCFSKTCSFDHPSDWKYADDGGKSGTQGWAIAVALVITMGGA